MTFLERFFFLVTFSLALFFFLPFFSFEKSFLSREQSIPEDLLTIRVVVSGAVASPGVYEERPGVCVKEILKKAGILPSADREMLYDKKILFSSCELVVPERASKKTEKKNSRSDKIAPFCFSVRLRSFPGDFRMILIVEKSTFLVVFPL